MASGGANAAPRIAAKGGDMQGVHPAFLPESAGWPREESNLRTRIRSPPLYPLSYGALTRECATE
jgi:hypothetical protein